MIDQHKTLSEKFLKKGFWLYLFSFIVAPIGYIIKIIISGELTVSEVGILYGIISLIILLSAYNDLGMSESLKFFIPKFIIEKRYDKVKSILFYAFFAQIITSIIIALFFFLGADFIANNYFKTNDAKETLKIFSFFFIGLNIIQTMSSFYMAIQNTFYERLVNLIRMTFVMIFVLFIFFGDLSSLVNYSYSWTIGLYIGMVITLLIFYKKYYKKYFKGEKIIFEKKLIKKIVKYALYVFLTTSIGTILGQIDMQMIIYMLGTNEAGYYTNYLNIISIPFILIGPIFGLLFPIFSEMHAKKEYEKIKVVKNLFQTNFLYLGIAFNILFFIFAENIAYILFGEKFITSGIILKYSILLLIFNFLLQINFNIMSGIGKIKERVKIIFIAVIFNFITNLIFINYLGVYGAALATGLGWILIWVLSELFLGKEYFVKFDYKPLIKNIILMGAIGYYSFLYIVPIFEGLSRLKSFLLLSIFGIIWFVVFSIINKKEVVIFIGEIKKLKKG